jgi:hypothetical protein
MNKAEIGTHATTIAHSNKKGVRVLLVTYQNTVVVKVINDRFVVLNSDGWETATTKRRMNQASMQYNLDYVVYQSGFVWYVRIGDDIMPYYDGITIDIKNKVISKQLIN